MTMLTQYSLVGAPRSKCAVPQLHVCVYGSRTEGFIPVNPAVHTPSILKRFIGVRVFHDGHGFGTIEALNDQGDDYAYSFRRYPFRVHFACGYCDVYAVSDLLYEARVVKYRGLTLC